jgi:hypothetical protein
MDLNCGDQSIDLEPEAREAMSQLQRRRAQNRASQRAFRARNQQRFKDLGDQLKDVMYRHEKLGRMHEALSKAHAELQKQIGAQNEQQDHGVQRWGSPGSGVAGDSEVNESSTDTFKGITVKFVMCGRCIGKAFEPASVMHL